MIRTDEQRFTTTLLAPFIREPFPLSYYRNRKKIRKEEAELFIRSILNKKPFYNQKSLSF